MENSGKRGPKKPKMQGKEIKNRERHRDERGGRSAPGDSRQMRGGRSAPGDSRQMRGGRSAPGDSQQMRGGRRTAEAGGGVRGPRKNLDIRRGGVRLDDEGAWWVRAGHPWVYRKTLKHDAGSAAEGRGGGLMEVLDPRGRFVGRGYLCKGGAVAMRILSTREAPRGAKGLVRMAVDEAVAIRESFLPADLTTYRLIHGEGEGLSGITVDRYGQYAVVTQYCEEAGFLIEDICEAIGERTGLEGIYLQKRFKPVSEKKQHSAASLIWGRKAEVEQIIHENGLKFYVDVRAPVSVGMFCDLREARSKVYELARNRRVVNCFSHTGSFSIYAAAAGAREVVSVDVSKKYLAWSKRNFNLNELDTDPHDFMASDASTAMARLSKKGRGPYDLIILDPPTFSSGKEGFVLKTDYPDLLESALEILEPGGLILACCNAVKISDDEFQRLISAGAVKAGRTLRILEKIGLPVDFPQVVGFREGAYLKAFLIAAF